VGRTEGIVIVERRVGPAFIDDSITATVGKAFRLYADGTTTIDGEPMTDDDISEMTFVIGERDGKKVPVLYTYKPSADEVAAMTTDDTRPLSGLRERIAQSNWRSSTILALIDEEAERLAADRARYATTLKSLEQLTTRYAALVEAARAVVEAPLGRNVLALRAALDREEQGWREQSRQMLADGTVDDLEEQ
jgi:hypothetical protein